MKQENTRCLVLNSDYSPIALISWKRAITLVAKHEQFEDIGVVIIDFYKNDFIRGTNNKRIPIPAVVKTVKYLKVHNRSISFNRKNVFLRDDYICQYCGNKFDVSQLTYDHVVPKSKWNYSNGTPTNWNNIVTSCIGCNRKKGHKTLQQACMNIKNIPIKPNSSYKYLKIYEYLNTIKYKIPEEWKPYINFYA